MHRIGQVGTSGALLDDGTMILGTPGPYTWRGTMFVISVGGEYLKRDKNHYYSPHLDQTSPVDKYSYLGLYKLTFLFLQHIFIFELLETYFISIFQEWP